MEIYTEKAWDSMSGAMPAHAEPANLSMARLVPEIAHWYAVQIRPQFEKKADAQLRRKGIQTFLPLLKQAHHWSDRHQLVAIPLFAGYDFVHLQLSPEARLTVLQTSGVIGFVGFQHSASPVPRRQIEALRQVLDANLECNIRPFLRTGQRVRIRGGALEGVEGILLDHGRKHVVISIECIQRSIAVAIEGYDLEVA